MQLAWTLRPDDDDYDDDVASLQLSEESAASLQADDHAVCDLDNQDQYHAITIFVQALCLYHLLSLAVDWLSNTHTHTYTNTH